MTGIVTLIRAIAKGFFRDRQAVFFALLFPIMFLVLFGALFADPSSSKSSLDVVGKVALIEDLSPGAAEAFDQQFTTHETDDLDRALKRVREGDVDAAVEQRGDRVILHFSQADRVKAATVQGTFSAFVDGANLDASHVEPTYALDLQQVEDESLESIQYLAPGLLGWAIAMSATFSAALTLVTWRQSELLRRMRLMPVSGTAILLARLVVSLGVALVQTAVFLAISTVAFDLQLTDSWWAAIPLVLAATTAFMAMGVFCGAIAKTNDGASGLANLIVMPMAFLSGSFIPLSVAPGWIEAVSRVLPLRYLNEGMLDVMVRGKGPSTVLAPLLGLLAFAAVVGLIGSRLIRWDKS